MTDNSEVVELIGFYHSKGVPVPVWVDFAAYFDSRKFD